MSVLGKAHGAMVFDRRVSVLADHLAEALPQGARVLDVGCGSGAIAAEIMRRRPDVRIEGVDVLVRPGTAIPVSPYDGEHLPFETDAFDVAMMIDVLHHTDDPALVLGEAQRVARLGVLVKDHFRDGPLAGPTLRFMDWVGNAHHGVRLPYNYLSGPEWSSLWSRLGLRVDHIRDRLGIYPAPFSWIFDRRLHFVALLVRA